MADVLLFHHALGLTDGVRAFADQLRAAGHRLTVPDLYDGATFDTIEDGVAHAEEVGFDPIVELAVKAADDLPDDIVCAGFSLGAMPAQKLAQTRPGALGALLYHGGDIPVSTYGPAWPDDVPLQVHLSAHDEWIERDVVEDLVEDADGELFIYPGSGHLFCDPTFSEYDEQSAQLVIERTIEFLARFP